MKIYMYIKKVALILIITFLLFFLFPIKKVNATSSVNIGEVVSINVVSGEMNVRVSFTGNYFKSYSIDNKYYHDISVGSNVYYYDYNYFNDSILININNKNYLYYVNNQEQNIVIGQPDDLDLSRITLTNINTLNYGVYRYSNNIFNANGFIYVEKYNGYSSPEGRIYINANSLNLNYCTKFYNNNLNEEIYIFKIINGVQVQFNFTDIFSEISLNTCNDIYAENGQTYYNLFNNDNCFVNLTIYDDDVNLNSNWIYNLSSIYFKFYVLQNNNYVETNIVKNSGFENQLIELPLYLGVDLTPANVSYKVYLLRIVNGSIVDCNGYDYENLFFPKNNNLLIPDEIKFGDYALSNYTFNERLESLTFNNELASIKGKAIITKTLYKDSFRNVYEYKLLTYNSNKIYTLYLNGFLNNSGININDVLNSYFIFINEPNNSIYLYIELVLKNTGEHILYSINENKVLRESPVVINSTNYSYIRNGTIYEYFIYYNCNINPDKFTEINFNYSWHKEYDQSGLLVNLLSGGIRNLNDCKYSFENGNFTLNSYGDPISRNVNGINKVLSIFSYNQNVSNNFETGSFVVDGLTYNYKMRFLVAGIDFNNIRETYYQLVNIIGFDSEETVKIDDIEFVKCSYLKDSLEYNNIYVVSNVDLNDPVDETPDINVLDKISTGINNLFGGLNISKILVYLLIGGVLFIFLWKILPSLIERYKK